MYSRLEAFAAIPGLMQRVDQQTMVEIFPHTRERRQKQLETQLPGAKNVSPFALFLPSLLKGRSDLMVGWAMW